MALTLPTRLSTALLTAGALVPLVLFAQDRPAPVASGAPAVAAAQAPGPDRFPEGVLARIGDRPVTLEQYHDHLFQVFGLGALEDMIYLHLLQEEAARVGLSVTAEELDAEWDRERRAMVARARGDERILLETLADMGYTEETYRARFEYSARPALLEAKLVVAAREVAEEAIVELFERRHGVGGQKVTLRHLYLGATRTRSELQAAGKTADELTTAAIDAAMVAKADELLGRLDGGAELEALCRAFSHDISVHQNGGVIPGYNYKHYGAEMAEAVRAAEVDMVVGPVRTNAGLHLIRVEERVVTALADVREELVAELNTAEATFLERGQLKQRLFREGDVSAPGLIGSRLVAGAEGELER